MLTSTNPATGEIVDELRGAHPRPGPSAHRRGPRTPRRVAADGVRPPGRDPARGRRSARRAAGRSGRADGPGDGQAARRRPRRGREVRVGVPLLRRPRRRAPGRRRRSTPTATAATSTTSRSVSSWRSCRGTSRSGRCSGSPRRRSWPATAHCSSTPPTSPAARSPSSELFADGGAPAGLFRSLKIGSKGVDAGARARARPGRDPHRQRAGRVRGGRDRRAAC